MPDGRPEPWRDDASFSVDVLEGGIEPPQWRRRWAAVPRRTRRLGAALLVLLVVGAVLVWSRDRAAERDRAQRVELTASLAVTSSSTSPPGGQVSYFVVVRNGGERPLSITSVAGTDDGLLLRMRDDRERAIGTGAEVAIPLSVRLTCPGGGDDGLGVVIGVRRQDGGSTTRDVVLEPAVLVRDVAATLCAVRPDLADHELSGPVLRGGAATDDGGR